MVIDLAPAPDARDPAPELSVAPDLGVSPDLAVPPELAAEIDGIEHEYPGPVAVPAAPPGPPQVCVLGPVLVKDAIGDVGERRASLTELAAFLVLHPGSQHHTVTEALWPGRRTDAQTRNSQMSRLRRWLGRDADGTFYLPMVNGSDGYNFARSVGCD